jgi:hypothetical protein
MCFWSCSRVAVYCLASYHLASQHHYDSLATYAARPCRLSKYCFRNSFSSVSFPRFSGVHFGSSLNKRIAFVYYAQTISTRHIPPHAPEKLTFCSSVVNR